MRRTLCTYSTACLVVLAVAAGQGPVSIARKYKAEDTSKYALTIKVVGGNEDVVASVDMEFKVVELLEGGRARVAMTPGQLAVTVDGNDTKLSMDPFDSEYDASGLPEVFPTNEAESLYSVLAIAGMAPNRQVKPGESFDFDWKNQAKTSTIKGKGKLLELAEFDGVKAAKLEYEVEIKPADQPQAATMSSTCWLALDDGRLLNAEGKVVVQNGETLNYTAKRLK